MAMKEQYYTVDGQMIGYKAAAGRKDFLTDALGSVTAEIDQTGATKTFNGRYKPYGGNYSETGTRSNYGWIGSWGYRETNLVTSSHYVRARHYSKVGGNWTTIDPLWPQQPAYSYLKGRVVTGIDYFGLEDAIGGDGGRWGGYSACATFQTGSWPFLWGSRANFSLQFCAWAYDHSCCGHGDWASRCRSVSLIGSMTWGPQLKDLLEALGAPGKILAAVKSFEHLMRALLGSAVGAGQTLFPEKGCVQKLPPTWDFSICARMCMIWSALQVCYPPGVGSASFGYCGLVTFSIRARLRWRECE